MRWLTAACVSPDVFGGGGKAAEPRRRLKGADPFERRKTIPFHKPNDISGHKILI
jgi:hypothetical protein